MAIQSSLLTTTISSIYTSNGSNAVTVVYVANYSTTDDAKFSLHAVPSAGSPSSQNIIYSNVVVKAGDTYVIDSERLLLENGDSVQVSVNANSRCSSTVSYTSI